MKLCFGRFLQGRKVQMSVEISGLDPSLFPSVGRRTFHSLRAGEGKFGEVKGELETRWLNQAHL